MGSYPPRPRFFAHRFVRLLAKSGAANELGSSACWMLTTIVMLEDSKRYKSHVTFYNEQLMGLCAFGGRKRLVESRDKAIASGWLHYEQGGKGIPGKYWVTIPDQYDDIVDSTFDDSDICRSETEQQRDMQTICRSETEQQRDIQTICRSETEQQRDIQTICRSETEHQPEQQGDSKRNSKGTPYIPIPKPIPKEKRPRFEKPSVDDVRSEHASLFPSVAFDEFWKAYPMRNGKRVGKQDAAKAFAKINSVEHADVMRAVRNYAASGQMPKDAGRFLRDDYWRDWITTAQAEESAPIQNPVSRRRRVS